MVGETWLTATLMSICACVLAMMCMTFMILFREYQHESRVWALDETFHEVELTTTTVQGVSAVTGGNIVMGFPVQMSDTVVVANYPAMIVGRPVLAQDQQLRAAGVV